MKFEAQDTYDIFENLTGTSHYGRGIGKVCVDYWMPDSLPTGTIWLYIDNPRNIIQSKSGVLKEKIEETAVKMYKEFTKYKISSRHIVVPEKSMFRVYDIETGGSICLTKAAIKKLGELK
jgi:hypothetical protein